MGIINHFLQSVQANPDRPALICEDERLTYRQVDERVRKLRMMLASMGIGGGSHVLVALPNGVPFALAMLALADLGAVMVPVSHTIGHGAMKRAMESGRAEFVIASGPYLARIWAEAVGEGPPVSPSRILTVGEPFGDARRMEWIDRFVGNPGPLRGGDRTNDAFILTMTSGSTSAPKPIVFSQGTKVRRALIGARDLYGLERDEVILTASPMHHSLGQRLVLLPLMIGATSVIMPRFNPTLWLRAVQEHGITFTIAVASHLEQLLNALDRQPGYDLSSLRCVVSSSALLKEAVKQRVLARFPCAIHECYGASEVGIVTNADPSECWESGRTVGRAVPGVDLKIVDDADNELPPGTPGQIICRTPMAFQGYFGQEEATQQAMRGGYFHTGDVGYLDEAGRLYLCGRMKDIVIVGGTNVHPEDVEAVLLEHPDIRECAVIGVEDEYFGEAILAVVAPCPGRTIQPASLRRFCAGKLADYQQPMAYEVVEELPRNELGKLAKPILREWFKGYDATAGIRAFLDRAAG
ncbi:MAG: acyl--CoA ligase [Phycisphaeraceae bacterium]|nr:acyl--CoA ligase [Phycisphaeraceae bacterium]